jgi:hypothetical protein
MAGLIYGLCALTAFLCAALLLRAYSHNRNRLLLWGGICFVWQTVSNALLVVDKLILPTTVDLSVYRHSITLLSMLLLLYGLIWNRE